LRMSKVRAVLLDIEGTTTPITFVADVLFPYARRELENYLNKEWETTVPKNLALLHQQYLEDQQNNYEVPPVDLTGTKEEIIQSVKANVYAQMDRDRKATALKAIQQHIWQYGYDSGELKGSIYPDVLPAFKQWKELNVPVYIYSSGSIGAQKLLFGKSTEGDLLDYFKGHFDTTSGAKIESASYVNISQAINIPPENILFVSDAIKELEAATQVGVNLRLSIRPGNAPVPDDHGYVAITSFDQLFGDASIEYVPAN